MKFSQINVQKGKKPDEKRTTYIPLIRLRPSEKDKIIKAQIKHSYVKLTDFIRDIIFDFLDDSGKENGSKRRKNKPRVEQKNYATFLVTLGFIRTELNRIGNNVNQIAHQMNAIKDGRVNENAFKKLEELKIQQTKLHQILDEIADKL